jgi:predicted HTH domain antitoxin
MTTLTLELPDKVLEELHRSTEEVTRDVRLATAVEWFRRGLISQGKAAELAGIPKADFLDELAARQIPVMPVNLAGLKAEIGLA